jgi:hypothetical protein
MSNVRRAGSSVAGIVPKKKIGPPILTTIVVILSQNS